MDPAALRRSNLAAVVDGHTEDFVRILHNHPEVIRRAALVEDCLANGYAPKGYGLADFTVVRRDGLFHLFHIPRVAGNSCIEFANEHWFGHATSSDLDTWTTCNPALATEPANHFESAHLWAPFVLQLPDQAWMFYTGLSSEPSQVLCSATSRDLASWTRSADNPIIPLGGFGWHWLNHRGHVRQARDPHVVRVGDHWLMAYTTMHRDGCPAVGGLVSSDLRRWDDIGPICYRPLHQPTLPGEWMPESVNIQQLADGRWAMIPSMSPGLTCHISDDPHAWHGSAARPIAVSGVDGGEAVALEVLIRDDRAGRWLVAFFGRINRMFIGELDVSGEVWRLRRITAKDEIGRWLA
jgi:predicted GH43/DUF377 family glycosyl hydrolase